jgi:probable F420-dependent oxidoreductase
VRFGVTLPNFQYGAPATPEHLLQTAQAAEACGYTSAWTSDHILVGSAFPRYGTLYEALTTLAWIGAQTRTIRLGTSILVLPMRNAILAAKQAATVDKLTGGRFVLGVGLGWNEGEYANVGADWKRRARVMDESLQVLRNLWTEERPSFAGTVYKYADTLFDPKPAQEGGPPIWIGGGSEAAIQRAARFGDNWHADEVQPGPFAAAVETLHTAAASHGRTVTASIRFTVDPFFATGQKRRDAALAGYYMGDQNAVGMRGSLETMIALVRRYRDLGATDFICQFEHDTSDQHVEFIRWFAREVIARI